MEGHIDVLCGHIGYSDPSVSSDRWLWLWVGFVRLCGHIGYSDPSVSSE